VTRITASATVLRELGGDVDLKIYAGLGHTVNADEIAHVHRILEGAARGGRT
jgi:predicted esterase